MLPGITNSSCGAVNCFDKETALDHAQWVQIGFIKQIVVLACSGRRDGLPIPTVAGTGRIVLRDVWDELIWIGTGTRASTPRGGWSPE